MANIFNIKFENMNVNMLYIILWALPLLIVLFILLYFLICIWGEYIKNLAKESHFEKMIKVIDVDLYMFIIDHILLISFFYLFMKGLKDFIVAYYFGPEFLHNVVWAFLNSLFLDLLLFNLIFEYCLILLFFLFLYQYRFIKFDFFIRCIFVITLIFFFFFFYNFCFDLLICIKFLK